MRRYHQAAVSAGETWGSARKSAAAAYPFGVRTAARCLQQSPTPRLATPHAAPQVGLRYSSRGLQCRKSQHRSRLALVPKGRREGWRATVACRLSCRALSSKILASLTSCCDRGPTFCRRCSVANVLERPHGD